MDTMRQAFSSSRTNGPSVRASLPASTMTQKMAASEAGPCQQQRLGLV